MRLIDADELIKCFETIHKQEDAIGLDFVAIIDEIKEQPYTYDMYNKALDDAIAKVSEYASLCMAFTNEMTKEQIAQEALNSAKSAMIDILEELKAFGDKSEKIKVTSAEIIVTGAADKPYFQIKYKEVGNDYYNIGFGSYYLTNVFAWREEYLEIVKAGEEK